MQGIGGAVQVKTLQMIFVVWVASFTTVGVVRRIALANGVMDQPTDRGSHSTPTPRGGGLGAIAAILPAFVWIASRQEGILHAMLLAVAGASAVALVGWLDDRRGLGVRSRLAVHILAGLTVGMLALALLPQGPPVVGAALFVWWAFWTVSSINLVNFMDGINGLVASQIAIFAGAAMLLGSASTPSSAYAAVVAGACAGFLPWNFPRARIFLGDVGSGTLGLLVPLVAVLVLRDDVSDIVRVHLPLLPLYGDATITILRRWRRGERLSVPHRSHLYQRLANGGFGHVRVTCLYALASIFGAIIARGPDSAPGWLGVAAYGAALLLAGLALERSLARATLT